jgi:flagellar FliL protein
MLILVVLGLINVGLTGWMAYTQHHGVRQRDAMAAEAAPAAAEAATPAEQPVLVALDPFVANLAEPLGKRYLRTAFELEVSSPTTGDELRKKTPQIRDGILLILTSKSFEDIRTTSGKGALREEIVTQLNTLLTTGKVRQIYFKEFVVQ